MRRFLLIALTAIAVLVSGAYAKEQAELRERVRDGAQRTDQDLEKSMHREKLNEEQRDRFDAAVKDLRELHEAATGTRWEGERKLLERAVDNIDFVIAHGAMEEGDRQLLGIDVYTLRVILDNWKQ
jgi:hypothetical protein